ncbi:uncharacterized protein PGTG_08295 [Puccinia graminis f. sp. tritici CRL 75-36-700-3]|uniref:Uncharacterized protein n=1 Tax=Puccinia graminis f. sp. tritici (strain CRL 75-36-700-3 / race SCCL) TaxID=418459 RepID=E3KDW4_PUCGT|nr:uncharacterized protein PGTG_08295 [Puccinia graminis f. sp. tritici CRL 75-36-700-3]EFP82339.2 hypothetical protein PGTG_08295 [Puccinia graminis f. sp. tritici CRL 75-36-700-3]
MNPANLIIQYDSDTQSDLTQDRKITPPNQGPAGIDLPPKKAKPESHDRNQRRRIGNHELADPFADSDSEDTGGQRPREDTPVTRTPHEQLYHDMGVAELGENVALTFHTLTEPQRSAALLAVQLSVHRRMDEIIRGGINPHPQVSAVTAVLSHEEQIRTFEYQKPAKDFIRMTARQCMTAENIETYAQDNHENSLFRLVMAEIALLPPAFQRAHLPPRFIGGDQSALNSVHTEVKNQLKQVRHKVRNVLLTGIVTGDAPAPIKVPDIQELSRLVWKHLMTTGRSNPLSESEIDTRINVFLKVRIAYLRLATLVNYLDPACRNISQWDQIDAQLVASRAHPINYTNHWNRLITSKDKALFGAKPMYADIDQDLISSPSDEEVHARMATGQRL